MMMSRIVSISPPKPQSVHSHLPAYPCFQTIAARRSTNRASSKARKMAKEQRESRTATSRCQRVVHRRSRRGLWGLISRRARAMKHCLTLANRRLLLLDPTSTLIRFGSRVRRGPARWSGASRLDVRLGPASALAGRLVLAARGDEAHAVALVLEQGCRKTVQPAVLALVLTGRQRRDEVRRLVQVFVDRAPGWEREDRQADRTIPLSKIRPLPGLLERLRGPAVGAVQRPRMSPP